MKSLTSLLPVFLPLLQVTLEDYHLPDSDEDEDEETAIQRVLQQVVLLPTQSPCSASSHCSGLDQLSALMHWALLQGHMNSHSSVLLLAGVLFFLVS